MKYNEQKGDLFKMDDKYALAHCVSADFEMGAGIAVLFDKNFRCMKDKCRDMMSMACMSFPCIVPYAIGENLIFNMVTKKNYWGKPTYITITKCIEEMAMLCRENNIKYLALPKIGCGLDRLQWAKVKEIIKENFKDLDIEIEVRYL